MKCWFHPEVDAVGVCRSCGRGVCKECLVIIEGNTYCKRCVESGRVVAPVPAVAKPKPTPIGVPSKGQFIAGGIGSIFNIISSVSLCISALSMLNVLFGVYYWQRQHYIVYPFIGIVFDILLIVGLVLAAIGYLGIRRNYGSGMGTASFVFTIIVAIALIISIIASITTIIIGYPYHYPEHWNWVSTLLIIQIIWFILFGVMQVVWGATHIITRDFTGKSGLSLATGIMLIIAGSLTTTLLLSFIGIALFFVAEIMASILFFTSEIPEATKP